MKEIGRAIVNFNEEFLLSLKVTNPRETTATHRLKVQAAALCRGHRALRAMGIGIGLAT